MKSASTLEAATEIWWDISGMLKEFRLTESLTALQFRAVSMSLFAWRLLALVHTNHSSVMKIVGLCVWFLGSLSLLRRLLNHKGSRQGQVRDNHETWNKTKEAKSSKAVGLSIFCDQKRLCPWDSLCVIRYTGFTRVLVSDRPGSIRSTGSCG